MTFGTLVLTACARNRLRSFFAFAAVAAAFCLFGALETVRYQPCMRALRGSITAGLFAR